MIQFHHVYKRFGAVTALEEVNIHIEKNKVVGLVGRNGAGKTTLLKLLAGCWQPTSGKVTVLGEHPFDNLFVSTNCILIDEEMVFPEVLSLGELLQVCEGFYPNWDDQLAKRFFTYFQLNKDLYYYQLSKGKKSTFNALVGLCSRVPVTIFDEPTSGMDQSVRDDFYKALLKEYINYPRTMIISSHHIDEVEHLLEEIILLDQGKPVLHLPIDDMRHYAIGVRGTEHELRSWLEDKTVLYEERAGMDEWFAIVKNDKKVMNATDGRFTVTAVSSAELAMYVTKGKKGRIDDVFNETN